MGDLIEGKFGLTGKQYDQKALPAPEVRDYVVVVAVVVDTAVIPAASEREAAEKYEMPAMCADHDVAVWAMTREEFDAIMRSNAPVEVEPTA